MKVKMLNDYCDVPGYPERGDVLEVTELVCLTPGILEFYACSWKDGRQLEIYPYECEEIEQ